MDSPQQQRDAANAPAWRGSLSSLTLGAVIVGVCVGLALFAPPGVSRALLHGWLARAAGPWSLPAVILAFAVFAFLGAPQLVLIAAAVLAFGPVWGALDSWAGTFVSALIGFGLGRRLGAPAFRRIGGVRAAAILSRLGRNGFAASLIVRLLPSVPFLAVNMVAGALPITALDFTFGTAIGIVPKIALVAVAGRSLFSASSPASLVWLIVAVAASIVLSLAAFLWLRMRRDRMDTTAPAAE